MSLDLKGEHFVSLYLKAVQTRWSAGVYVNTIRSVNSLPLRQNVEDERVVHLFLKAIISVCSVRRSSKKVWIIPSAVAGVINLL